MSDPELNQKIKEMMVESLMLKMTPDQIGDDTPLFDPAGLGLDSIDALELSVAIEKKFGAPVENAEVARKAFVSVKTVAEHIREHKKG